MGSRLIDIVWNGEFDVKIQKWKIKKGMPVSARQVIMLYSLVGSTDTPFQKFKTSKVGTVYKLCTEEDAIIKPGQVLVQLEECTHPTVMADMCAECGADLRQAKGDLVVASVPMVHSIPDLKVSREQAQILGKADETRLLSDHKLVLLVDLDQTLIHTTNDNIPPNLKDVVHFQLYGPQSPWYHTRIRPGTQRFLQAVSELFELHICTFGARSYAHCIATFLDPDGRFFSHRILSRDECFDPNSKTANLSALFPCGDAMVCIIDDREDVWNFAPNLVHVKPYHFFQHTGDINAPPGLTKRENDSTEDGFDFTKFGVSKPEDDSGDKEVEMITSTPHNKSKPAKSGETTTDKDTDDEADSKTKTRKSIGEEDKSLEQNLSTNDDVEKCEDIIGSSTINDVEVDNEETQESKETKQLADTNIEKDLVNTDQVPISSVSESSNSEAIKTPEVIEEEAKISNTNTDALSEKVVSTEDEPVISLNETKEKSENTTSDKPDSLLAKNDELGKHGEGKDEDLIEVEDTDDYLLYLEDILRKIHTTFYDIYDKAQGKALPDLKAVVPDVRRSVLKNCCLVLSGMVPSHVPLERSRAYLVAESLGATVEAEVTAATTHLIAARPGTAKVNSARRRRGIHIITPQWLWHCAERWEHVDERLYPLGRGVKTNRHPPAHCGSPQHPEGPPAPIPRRFSETINPLLTLSSEDVASMDQEVEELCQDDDSDSDVEEEQAKKSPVLRHLELEHESSSSDSLTGRSPRGWNEGESRKSRKRKMDTTTCTESDFEDESPSVKFRRGEPLPSDLDLGEDSVDDSQDQDGDDSAWTLMGAALEREFLSGD